jgi:hypothetical protein
MSEIPKRQRRGMQKPGAAPQASGKKNSSAVGAKSRLTPTTCSAPSDLKVHWDVYLGRCPSLLHFVPLALQTYWRR